MRHKLIELIRRILIKLILPIRNKREQWLSNFRLSMAFRISAVYLKLMLTHGLLFMIGFFLIFIYTEKINCDELADDFIKSFSESEEEHFENPCDGQGIYLKIVDQSNGAVVFDDFVIYEGTEKSVFFGIRFDWKSKIGALEIDRRAQIVRNGRKYTVYFRYDMTDSYLKYISLSWKILLLYLLVVYLVIRKGKRSDGKLFEPVRTMTATANRLTVNNLHSERLNVEGTKNELKDLAGVINEMLDRIETSYESQKQFVSDASHELRTPIAVIQGYANLLNRWGTTNEEVLHESIEAIQNEARSMQDLVEKLLFLSRHDKKTLKLTKKRFNMRKLVDDMVKETKLVAVNRVIHNPVMEDVIVYGDKQSLKQAIRIFIDNAVKYTNDGDEITITCQKVNEDCVITVQDTGIGMTKKDIDHIFDRFYRSDYVRNQNISGHGLGLSLAKLIILAHTGKIKIRSQFKKGTSFMITLPKRKNL